MTNINDHVLRFSDGSHAENALTKTEDGTFSLHKSLLHKAAGNTLDDSVEALLDPPQTPILWKKSQGMLIDYCSRVNKVYFA